MFRDAWHETYRERLNPALPAVRQAAERCGAIGTWLSGSGSTILSLCHRDQAAAVETELSTLQLGAVSSAAFDNDGLQLEVLD